MKRLSAVVLLLGMLGCDGVSPVSFDPEKGILLTYPTGGETFSIGEQVTVSWMVNTGLIAMVALEISNTGADGPWRQVFGKGMSPQQEGSAIRMDTVWVVGNEWEKNLIDYSTGGSVRLRLKSYLSEHNDVSSTIFIRQ